MEGKDGMAMWILGIILLIAPGLLALFCNGHDFSDRKQIAKGTAKFFIFVLQATMITFALVTGIKGKVIINLMKEGEEPYNLSRSFVFILLGAMQTGSSVVLGILEKRYHGFIMRILHFLWNDDTSGERAKRKTEGSRVDKAFSEDLHERNQEIKEVQENDSAVRDEINKKYSK